MRVIWFLVKWGSIFRCHIINYVYFVFWSFESIEYYYIEIIIIWGWFEEPAS